MGGPDQIAAVSVKIRSDGCTLLNAALFHVYSGTTVENQCIFVQTKPTEKNFWNYSFFLPSRFPRSTLSTGYQ